VANVFISDLECNSLDTCAVIGRADQGSFDSEFIQVESGGHWKSAIEVPAVEIRGHRWRFDIVHSYVHCIDFGDCAISAAVTFGNESRSVVDEEVHGRWTEDVQSVPSGLVNGDSLVSTFACHLETICVVAGVSNDPSGTSTVYAVIQKRGHWGSYFSTESSDRFAIDGVTTSQPLASTCPNARTCVVVGVVKQASGQDASFVARYRGDHWSSAIVNLGQSNDVTQISGLSCSTTSCWAVGTVFSSGYIPLVGIAIHISA
jgi:hypothetical protein